MRRERKVVMLGPSLQSRGGVSSVSAAWREAGVFARWPVVYLSTHVEGPKWRKAIAAAAALRRFVGLLASGKVGCVYAHVARRRSVWRKAVFVALALPLRVPVVIHIHSGGFGTFFYEECGRLGRSIVRALLDRASEVVVLSEAGATVVREITANARLGIVRNFVRLPADIRGHDGEQGRKYVLFVGRLTAEKGFYDLLGAFRAVERVSPELRLVCAGTGDEEARQAVRETGLGERVDLTGWVEGRTKEELLRDALIFVQPSYVEGIPMSVLEAMAWGRAVVATGVGGVPELMRDGIEGLVVRPGDVAGLARAITRLAADRELRGRLGRAARRRVEREYSAEAVLPQIDAVLGRSCGPDGRRVA